MFYYMNKHLQEIPLPFKLVFVGGAPRSGTTVLHAAVCSSDNVNNYVSECSYFKALVKAYYAGINNFHAHTSDLFKTHAEFFVYHSNLLREVLIDHWQYLGRPQVLALKDPLMTYDFPTLNAFFPDAKFVVSIRNPFDLALSRKRVLEKENPQAKVTLNHHAQTCRELVSLYATIVNNQNKFKNNLMMLRYEDFVQGNQDQNLNQFLGIKINRDKVWQDAHTNRKANNPWDTDKYWKPIQNSSVNAFRTGLNQDEMNFIAQETKQFIEMFNYTDLLQEQRSSSISQS